MCLQRNQQKDGGKEKVLSYFPAFLQSELEKRLKLHLSTISALRKESRTCALVWGSFFVWLGIFLSLHASLSNFVTWGMEHYDPLFSRALKIWTYSPFTSRIKDFTMFHTSYSGKSRQNTYISRAASQSIHFFRHLMFDLGVRKRKPAREIHISTCLAHKHNFVLPAKPETFSECNYTSEGATCF